MKKLLIVLVLLFVASLAISLAYGQESVRGKYIYDDVGKLSVESKAVLSSYLWKVDTRTGYEIVIAFPKEKLDETKIIDWFNNHGVGKKTIDNGAVLFIFPDNTWFMSIGSGNDQVSVAKSSAYGKRILTGLDNDLPLKLFKFVTVIGGDITKTNDSEFRESLGQTFIEYSPIVLGWVAVVALTAFLLQQRDGFQAKDLVIPIIVLIAFGLVVGTSYASTNDDFKTYNSYGITTTTLKTSEPHTHTHVVCSGGKVKTCTTYYTHHTHYYNNVGIISYDGKNYTYRFFTEDSKGAWSVDSGDVEHLVLKSRDNTLQSVISFNDNSGGKTIGDGVWGKS